MKTLIMLLAFAVPATASPIMLGPSWDGPVPGTFADIAGGVDSLGHPDFAAGMWRISMEAGHTAWATQDVVGFEGDSFCATAAVPCTLGGAGTTLEVYQDRAWHLWATTPSYTHQLSIGDQFAFVQTGPNQWKVGLEDISLGVSDRDFQDVLLTLTYLGSPSDSTPFAPAPTAVPEPFTLLLVSGAFAFARLVKR